MASQAEFDFDSVGVEAGHARWMAVRQVASVELARRLGLPLGHVVEIWLRGKVRLR